MSEIPMALPATDTKELNAQAKSDTVNFARIAVIVTIIVIVGFIGFVANMNGSLGPTMISLLVFAPIALGIGWAIRKSQLRQYMPHSMSFPDPGATTNAQREGPAYSQEGNSLQSLNYQSRYSTDPPRSAWAIARGFFLAMGVCIAGFIALIATVDKGRASALIPLMAFTAFIGTAIYAGFRSGHPGQRGFGLGATIGLILGGLALIPCGFCYLAFALNG